MQLREQVTSHCPVIDFQGPPGGSLNLEEQAVQSKGFVLAPRQRKTNVCAAPSLDGTSTFKSKQGPLCTYRVPFLPYRACVTDVGAGVRRAGPEGGTRIAGPAWNQEASSPEWRQEPPDAFRNPPAGEIPTTTSRSARLCSVFFLSPSSAVLAANLLWARLSILFFCKIACLKCH